MIDFFKCSIDSDQEKKEQFLCVPVPVANIDHGEELSDLLGRVHRVVVGNLHAERELYFITHNKRKGVKCGVW